MIELCSVKAHGDGAAQIAVESLDYCGKRRCLASVAEGLGSVRLWDVSDAGKPLVLSTVSWFPHLNQVC
jgi:hypothetical protein